MPVNPFASPRSRKPAKTAAKPDETAAFAPEVIAGGGKIASRPALPVETPAEAARKLIAEGLFGAAVAGNASLGDLVSQLAGSLGTKAPMTPDVESAETKPDMEGADGVVDMAEAVDDRIAETLIDMMRDDPADEQVA